MASVILQEKANFTRLSRLLVDKGTEALRITLDAIHAPANLPAVLNANRATLLRLKPRVINDTQWDLLFPPSGNPPDSKTFDVTLLTILLRNLSGLPPPATGWNTMPPDTDNSIEANITRIKLFRNQVYGHVTSTQVDQTTFDYLWLKISKALFDLKIRANEIDELKTCPLGPEEQIYEQSLKEWFLKEEECKDMLDDLKKKVDLLHNELMDDRVNMKHFKQIMEQSHQGIRQLCAANSNEPELSKPMSHSNRKIDEKHSTNMDEQLLQGLAKHNFKSKIQRKVKFFYPGTREWLLEKIFRWFERKDESRILLITAVPGFGKSVFAAKVCEVFEEMRKLAACHFCDFSNSNLKDPMKMLQSLASHMCQNLAGFKEKLLDQLKRPHEVRSLKDAFQIYLQNPLDEVEVERSLIVIDGLDESATDDKSDIVKLIVDNFPDLPECVKVLVTSRPELSVQGLDCVEKIEINVEHVGNRLDILEYLRFCLPTLAGRDAMNRSTRQDFPFEVLPDVVENCDGSFLYAFHVQRELNKREDLDTVTFGEIMSFLPEGMGSVFHDYFHRLEKELKAVMKRNPDLFKILELLVAINTNEGLPLKFIARALDLPLDCRETKKIINKVNDAVSCLLYVSDDLITIFHKSVYDWLVADGYDEHEYTVKVSDGKKRLWLICEQVFKEVKNVVSSGKDLKLTNEVKHSLEYGHEYLLACDMKDSFSWLVDMIIIHVLLNVHPKSTHYFHSIKIFGNNWLDSDPTLSLQLRQRISWHAAEISYLHFLQKYFGFKSKSERIVPYLESVLEYSPEGCFTDDERKMAEFILAKSPRCVKRISAGMKSLNPLFTNYFSSNTIVAVGVSSCKRSAAVALDDGTIWVLSLPDLIKSWQCSTQNTCISCCTFAPDDTYVLYGKLETVIDIGQRKEVTFFSGEVENFKSCAFSPNGKRLLTNNGSNTLKLWDVVRRSLVAVLSVGAPVDCCRFTSTGLFIVADTSFKKEDTYCVWNSVTLQRVDERTRFSCNEGGNKDGVLRSKRCNRCFRKERKELIASKEVGIVCSMQLNRHTHNIYPARKCSRIRTILSTGVYKGVDCFFYLEKQASWQSLHIIESTHFTTIAAWEIYCLYFTRDLPFVYIAAIEDDHWLYSDDMSLVAFNSVPRSETQRPSCPTCVLWCSFSPDGTRLAACTSDGFVYLWHVKTSQVYQCFRNSRNISSGACWWSDKYLFVCHLTDAIPSLSRYPIDGSLKMVIDERQSLTLCSVKDAFLPFSEFLVFSEGYLGFECGGTEPVKVVDVTKVGHPHPIMLPGIKPMMSIAVSSRALFVLAAGRSKYFLWKRKETQPTVYYVFARLKNPQDILLHVHHECCFSNDFKFAVVSFRLMRTLEMHFHVIDVDTGISTVVDITNEKPVFYPIVTKMFCTDTFIIRLTLNTIEIFYLNKWKRLGFSFQRCLTEDFVIHSKLSPKGNVLAVPRLTGVMEFFELRIPKQF